MDFLNEFHFLRPLWFIAILILLGALWLFWRKQYNSKNWEKVCDKELLPHILVGHTIHQRKSTFWLMSLGGLLAIIALAGPTNEKLPQPAITDESALVIVFDLSRSMDAVDISPNRLTRAKYKINDLIKQRRNGQTALVVYAADAFTVMPLTDDLNAVEEYLASLNTSMLTEQGSRPDLAMQQAVNLIKQAGLKRGDILIVSDYVDTKRSLAIARDIANQTFRVSTLGIGSQQGAPIQLKSGNLLTHKGKTVIARFEPQNLKSLAQAGKGIYRQFDPLGDSDITAFNQLFQSRPDIKKDSSSKEVFGDQWKEQGPWLILLLLPISMLAFRRGILVLILGIGVGLSLSPLPANADLWDDLWLRNDQQGVQAIKQGDNEKAETLLNNPHWQFVNVYRKGDYKEASQLIKPQTANDWYNNGNAFAHNGKIEDAIKSYEKALTIDPYMEDAKHNLDILKSLKKEERPAENQQGGDEEQGESKDNQQSESTNKEQGEQEKQENQQSNENDTSEEQNEEQNIQKDKGEQEPTDESSEQSISDNEENDESTEANEEANNFGSEGETMPEDKQATEQWLRQIGNDPTQMLRRKFQYQQRLEQKNTGKGENPW